jgi:hypothetical protein
MDYVAALTIIYKFYNDCIGKKCNLNILCGITTRMQ